MESKDIVFSLVIGTYNPNKEWLDQALKSAEGLFDEIIIVDDGSKVPVEVSVGLSENIHVVHHVHNRGFWHARNTGCYLAKGKWIISLDDDDLFIRDSVETLKQIASTTEADIIHFPIELFGNSTGFWAANPNLDNLLESNQVPSGSWFKKEVWEKLKGFQLAEGEDWDFWARAKKHGFKFKHAHFVGYQHRMRKGSMSENWVGDKFIEIRNNVRKNYEKEEV